jgi:FtsZ-binding cell division protein ZapB
MIYKPETMSYKDKNIICIISGLPGTGKTTLALSSPDVLLIDTDEGLCRVKSEHRKDASICKNYEEILTDIKSAEGNYKTIVIDTAGALIDYLKDWAIRTDPKSSKTNGGISLQGFGVVKQEFLRFSSELRKKFNVVYLFHEKREKNDDDIFYSIVCEGAARELVYQPADLAAHLFIQNGKRYLGFTPTEQYTAKSAYGIGGLIEVPELKEGEPNVFLTKLFATVRKNLESENVELNAKQKIYEETIKAGMAKINALDKPEDVDKTLAEIKKLRHELTSEKELLAALKGRLTDLNIVYNKAAKKYEYAPKTEV